VGSSSNGNGKVGRPTTLTAQIIVDLCTNLLESDKGTLREAVEKTAKVSSVGLVYTWLSGTGELAEQLGAALARARQARAWALADEMLEIADGMSNDVHPTTGRTRKSVIQRDRLRVQARQFLLQRLLPHIYGDKLEVLGDVTHTHKGGVMLIPATSNEEDWSKEVKAHEERIKQLPAQDGQGGEG
jgi:hypothetical protein